MLMNMYIGINTSNVYTSNVYSNISYDIYPNYDIYPSRSIEQNNKYIMFSLIRRI